MAAVTTAPQVFTSGCFMLLKTGTLLTWHCRRHEKSTGTRDGLSWSTGSRAGPRAPHAAVAKLYHCCDPPGLLLEKAVGATGLNGSISPPPCSQPSSLPNKRPLSSCLAGSYQGHRAGFG